MNTPRLLPRHWFAGSDVPVRVRQASPAAPFRQDIGSLFDAMFRDVMSPWADFDFMPAFSGKPDAALAPRMDVTSNDEAYTVKAELPGVDADAVRVEVRDGALILHGEKKQEHTEEKENYYLSERSFGSFERVLRLPDDADVEAISAAHKDGVLTVAIPRKAQEKPQSRTIEVAKGEEKPEA